MKASDYKFNAPLNTELKNCKVDLMNARKALDAFFTTEYVSNSAHHEKEELLRANVTLCEAKEQMALAAIELDVATQEHSFKLKAYSDEITYIERCAKERAETAALIASWKGEE